MNCMNFVVSLDLIRFQEGVVPSSSHDILQSGIRNKYPKIIARVSSETNCRISLRVEVTKEVLNDQF